MGQNNWWQSGAAKASSQTESCVPSVVSKSSEQEATRQLFICHYQLLFDEKPLSWQKCICLPWEKVKHWGVNKPSISGLCGFSLMSNQC